MYYSNIIRDVNIGVMCKTDGIPSLLLIVVRSSLSRSRHCGVSVLVLVVPVLSFVDHCSDEVENAALYVSRGHASV